MVALPLEGVRVLDITVVWAGPYATMLLGDWGAQVIRVESTQVFQPTTRGYIARPSRELVRATPSSMMAYPNWEPGPRPWNRYPGFNSHARNKLSMTVDLRRPEGREVFLQLVQVSDILIENNTPDLMEKLRLTYEDLRPYRPDLIMVRMPAYGLSGPYRDYRSFGSHMESVVGHTWLRGYPDSDPSLRGEVYAADAVAGILGAFAALAALRHRRRTGQGQLVELSIAEAFVPLLGGAFLDWALNRRVQGTLGNRHPFKAPHNCYPCRGRDRWLVIAVATDRQFRALCRVMGRPGLAEDPRFADALSRWHHQEELDAIIARWTAGLEAGEAFRLLQEAGVPAGPVLTEADLLADPHLKARGFFQPLTQADAGTYLYHGPLWRARHTPNRLRTPPVRLGEHNGFVYRELLGFAPEDYNRLVELGHIGDDYRPDIP